jgi:hypothetical protein
VRETAKMVIFQRDDDGYLQWVADNQNGFVVNIDYTHTYPDYPMVHRATHKALSTQRRKNYTTGQYYKVCSTDLSELQAWSRRETGKELIECQTCMRQGSPARGS